MRDSLCFRVPERVREAVERLADAEDVAYSEMARELLNEGLKGRGIEC